jgi:hypothetical protein
MIAGRVRLTVRRAQSPCGERVSISTRRFARAAPISFRRPPATVYATTRKRAAVLARIALFLFGAIEEPNGSEVRWDLISRPSEAPALRFLNECDAQPAIAHQAYMGRGQPNVIGDNRTGSAAPNN